MSCYYPMSAVRMLNGDIKVIAEQAYSPNYKLGEVEVLKVPCGKCVGCRLDYSREWANRCMNEAETSSNCWFITLTYNNEHLPYNSLTDDSSGLKINVPTLCPDDLTNFLKRLRERLRRQGNTDFRYYACGEYGEKYERPHYHLIVFNCPISDLSFFYSKNGFNYYCSDFIADCWSVADFKSNQVVEKSPIGHVLITEVTWETCAYVARYVMKKQKGKNAFEYYSDKGILPEFVRMSRRPGIGYQWYAKNKDQIYKFDRIGYKNGIPLKPGSYYDRLFDVDNHERLVQVKELRKRLAVNSNKVTMNNCSYTAEEYRQILENNKIDSARLLKRTLTDFE